MSKYYNKEIPDELHVVFSDRHYAKTYYELMKLKERIKELEEENKRLELENEKHKSWVNSLNKDNHKFKDRINKAIEYIEKNTEYLDIEKGEVFSCMGAKGHRIEIIGTSGLLKILKGEENEN